MSAPVSHRNVSVIDGRSGAALKLFYRAAGPIDAPVVLLLHGFPSSSHQYRGLIDRLSGKYRVIAPDLPGFGLSDAPDRSVFAYDFDHLAEVIAGFTDALGLDRYALYVFDYGAPVGFRLAMARPDRIVALMSQNGNAYEEGLSEGWAPMRAYWQAPTAENREKLRVFLRPETTKFQYEQGEAERSRIAPESYLLDQLFLDRPGNDEIQLDLFANYQSNIDAYPRFQDYFRSHRPPMLAVWGRNDPFFLAAGAEAFRRDNPAAEVRLIDGGHFLLEAHLDEVARIILDFLGRTLDARRGAALFGALDGRCGSASTQELLDGMRGLFGFAPSLSFALAIEPAALGAYLTMMQSLEATALDPIAQQVALIAASHANGSRYCVALHVGVAAKLGASAELVAALREGAAIADPKLEAVRRFSAAVAAKQTQVSDSDIAALAAVGYDHRAAVAIALAAAAKLLANLVEHLARPEIDFFAQEFAI